MKILIGFLVLSLVSTLWLIWEAKHAPLLEEEIDG